MSRNMSTHSHNATKINKSTNHDMNTHVNDGQKKRGEGGKTQNKQRRLEVAPVVHNPMVSHELILVNYCHDLTSNLSDFSLKDPKDTATTTKDHEAPFDAKTILPESKSLKSITQLLESMKKVVCFFFPL